MSEEAPLVDVTLIDAMIALTVKERLLLNDRMIQTITQLREAFQVAEQRPHEPEA